MGGIPQIHHPPRMVDPKKAIGLPPILTYVRARPNSATPEGVMERKSLA